MNLKQEETGIMRVDLGWAELGLGVLVVVLSLGGSLLANAYKDGQTEQRITALEAKEERFLTLMEELSRNVGGLNVVLGRVDERLKNVEERGN